MSIAEEAVGVPLRQRRHNTGRVLEVLRDSSDPITAADLMVSTGLSRQTVHALCDELIGLGLVTETESTAPRSATGVGRPSRTFAFNERAGFVAGIELGPERIAAQLCDLRGDIVASTEVESSGPTRPATDLIEHAKRIIDDLVTESGVDARLVTTLAVGVPAPVDLEGVAGRATRVPGLSVTNVVEAFSSGRTWTVLADNDANLAVAGERWRGVAQGAECVVLLLVEEQYGAGIIDSGRTVRGSNGFAGQMEFVSLLEGGRGTRGIVPHIAHLLDQLSEADRVRITSTTLAGGATTRPEQDKRREANAVFDAALDADPVARTIIDAVADRLARVTAVVATLLDPDIVVFACEVPHDADAILAPVRRRLATLMQGEPPTLARSELQGQAVATGAVRSALDHVHPRLLP